MSDCICPSYACDVDCPACAGFEFNACLHPMAATIDALVNNRLYVEPDWYRAVATEEDLLP